MMMIPKRKNEFDLFDDMFNDSFLMSGNSSRLMKTDIKEKDKEYVIEMDLPCLLYTSPSPRDETSSRMPSSA